MSIKQKRYSKRARLRRKKELRAYRRAIFILVVSLILLLSLSLWGIQGLVKLASFWGMLYQRESPLPTRQPGPLLPPRLVSPPIATNSPVLDLWGFAESGVTVEVFLNNVLARKVLVGQDGEFQVKDLVLVGGENQIYALARKDEQESFPSRTATVIYKETPPELEVIEPKDGAIFSGKEKTVNLAGKTDPQASVTVNGHWVIVQTDGSFFYKLPLSEGENPIEVIARDAAGNQTEVKLSVQYKAE